MKINIFRKKISIILNNLSNLIDQQERKIVLLPNFFEYCSYIFFFGGCVAGPTFGFTEFYDFINKRKQYTCIPLGFVETLKNLCVAFCFIASIVIFMPIFPVQYLMTLEFTSHCFFYQFSYLIICLLLIRIRYYGAWTLSQSNMTACGMSFTGIDKDGKEQWNNVLTADPTLEFYSSPKDKQDVLF